MEITADTSTLGGKVLCFLTSACGLGCVKKASTANTLRVVKDGKAVIDGDYPVTAIRHVAGECLAKGRSLGGSSVEEQGQVDGWLSLVLDNNANGGGKVTSFEGLNAHLRMRSYLTGASFTIADVAVFMALLAVYKPEDFVAAKKDHVDFIRWFDQTQNEIRALAPKCGVATFIDLGAMAPAAPLPLPKAPPMSSSSSEGGVAVAAANGETAADSKGSKEGKQTGQEGKAEAKGGKGGKEEKKAAAGSGGGGGEGGGKAAAAGEEGGDSQKKQKKEKKGKEPKGDAAPAAAGGGGDGAEPITMLDIRVGKILKAWPHPDRDKLYAEEIELGEAAPRTICSGLRDFYSESSMLEGKMVLVVANLKPRAMGSVKSAGMVMCASSPDHSKVVLVDAPAGAKPGDKITFPGKVGEPCSAAQTEKKKVLEKCFPLMKTDGAGVPNYDGCPFTIEGLGTCTSSIANGNVA